MLAAAAVPLVFAGAVTAALLARPHDVALAEPYPPGTGDATTGAGQLPAAAAHASGRMSRWTSHLPGPLRFAALQVQALAGHLALGIESRIPGHARTVAPQPAPAAQPNTARAAASWNALQRQMGVRGLDGLMVEHAGGLAVASVWPQGQAVAAALDVARVTGDWKPANDVIARLADYRAGNAYAPTPLDAPVITTRYYDDNAWLGLDFMQAYQQSHDASYLRAAESLVPFLDAGRLPGGGIAWVEKAARPSVNTCSVAPTIELLLRLHQATGKQEYLDRAKELDNILNSKLRRPDGLYADHYDAGTGSVDAAVYSYNQGTPVGADVLWYRTTGDPAYLDRARATAAATLDYFAQDDRLWSQPPAFNAILFRNLLALDAVSPGPRIRMAMTSYVERAWKDARDPQTGLFTKGGIGHYGPAGQMSMLDQAAMVQMYALLDFPKADLPLVS